MKTIFISLLLMVAGAVTAFANTTPQDYILRNVQITFDVNPNNPEAQNISCTVEIPDGTSTTDYYTRTVTATNYASVEHIYNSPEEIHITFNLQYPYNDQVKLDATASSTEGNIQYMKYIGSKSVHIRCETPIQEGSKYYIKVRVGY